MVLRALNNTLKSLTLEASSGSLEGVQKLNSYLHSHAPDPSKLVPVAHAVLSGLSSNDIPSITSALDVLDHEEVIRCAALSLGSLTYLASDHKDPSFPSFFVQNQEIICRWLLFFARDVVFREPSHLLSLSPMPDVSFIVNIFSYFKFVRPTDYTLARNAHISNTILEMWNALQVIDLSGELITTLAADADDLVAGVLQQMLPITRSHDFILQLGGFPYIPDLYVTSIRRYLGILQSEPSIGVSPIYDLLHRQTYFFLYFFVEELLPYSILSQDAIHQINICMKYLFENRPRAKSYPVIRDRELIMAIYCDVIVPCPVLPGFYPVLDMLAVGNVADLRSVNFSDERSRILDELTQTLFVYAKFPRAIPFIEKLTTLPSSSRTWLDWDDDVSPFILAWNETLAEAKQYEGCNLCGKSSGQCRIKACSACRISRYCSTECQRADWKDNHRWRCELYQLCGTSHPLLQTNSARGLFYTSSLEREWDRSQESKSHRLAQMAGRQAVPADEIPLLYHPLDMHRDKLKLKRFGDFPELFGSKLMRQLVVPRIKELITAEAIPDYLTVLSLNVSEDFIFGPKFHILSPSIAILLGNFPTLMQRNITEQMFPGFKWEGKDLY